MKITQLSAKPQLIKITLDDKETLEQYGEAVEFWTWDRQPLDTFIRLASATEANSSGIINIVKDLILDEQGKPVLTADTMLPTGILMRAIAQVTEVLGK